jgi:prepilin-type N-terminal cleavage/methylation domain-containing protein
MKNIGYPRSNSGFTFIELVTAVTIIASLLALVTINLVNTRQKTTINTVVTTLVTDLRNQQVQAMVGDTEGRGTNSTYGIHFDSAQNRYILFHGTYSSSDPTNLVVKLDNSLQFSAITFPSSEVNFALVSGEMVGFASGQDSVTITDQLSSTSKTIRLNKYGVVVQD